MKTVITWNNQETIQKLKKSLENDAISLVSTDTVLGLLARLSQPSFQKLNDLKGGRNQKPYLILVRGGDKLKHFIDFEVVAQTVTRVIDHCWPGPVTFVLKAKENLAPFLKSADNTIALRCPEHDGLQQLLQHFDGLFSTSANKSGQPIPDALDAVDQKILESIDHVVVDDHEFSKIPSSTIIDFSGINPDGNGKVKVIREGAYSVEEIERIYGSKFER